MTDTTWISLMKLGQYSGCHQMPERSFFYKNYQFPVCARCTGVILASIITMPIFFIRKLNIFVALFMSGIMFIDWFLQFINVKPSTNRRRFITGIVGGIGWSTIHMYFYYLIFAFIRKRRCTEY